MSDHDEVIAAERLWVEIYKKNDAGRLAQIITDDFIYTSPVGEKVQQSTYLENLGNRTVQMSSVEPSDEEVRIHGDCAVVTATWTVQEEYRGVAFNGPVRITRVWVRESSTWKALAFQVTDARKKN